MHIQPSSSGLPRRLKLLLVELGGLAVMGVGVWSLVAGNLLGVLVVLAGVDLLLRPGARRKVPRVDQLLLKLLDRWRSPPAP